jgi:hypothetical protein
VYFTFKNINSGTSHVDKYKEERSNLQGGSHRNENEFQRFHLFRWKLLCYVAKNFQHSIVLFISQYLGHDPVTREGGLDMQHFPIVSRKSHGKYVSPKKHNRIRAL